MCEEIEKDALVEKGGEAQELMDLGEGSRRGGIVRWTGTIHCLRGQARARPCL